VMSKSATLPASIETLDRDTGSLTIATPHHRTVLYIRVSTDDQAKEGNSLTDQERAGRLTVAARVAMGEGGWTEIADGDRDIYADPGVSGATRDRPGLKRLMADAKAGKIGRVVVTKLDRMSRRAADLLAIEDEFDRYGVARTYIKDSIDTSTPTGRLLRTVLAAVAELERDLILERTAAGRVEAIRKGLVWRSKGILGYHCLPSDKETGQRGRLDIDEVTAPLVRHIFTSIASGVSCRTLAARLNAEGVPTVGGGAMWRHNTIQRIIMNPAYTGRAAYGRLRRTKVRDDATDMMRSVVRRGDPEQVLYVDVPAIVSLELAQDAQAMLTRNRVMSSRNAKHDYLLGGGLVRCNAVLADDRPCLSIMRGESHRGVVYRCNHQEPEGARRHTIPASALDDTVWNALCGLMRDPDTVLAEVEDLAADGQRQAADADADIARLDRAARDIETQQGRLLDLYLTGRLDVGAYTAKADTLAAQRETVAGQRSAAEERRGGGDVVQLPPVRETRAMCDEIAQRLDGLTFDQRRHLVRTLFTRVVANRETVEIEGAFETPAAAAGSTIADRTSGRCGRRPPRLRACA